MSPPACHSYGMTCFSRILLVGLYLPGDDLVDEDRLQD